METNQPKISVKDLTEEITLLIKEEIVATYTEEDDALQVHFWTVKTSVLKSKKSWNKQKVFTKDNPIIYRRVT